MKQLIHSFMMAKKEKSSQLIQRRNN